MRGAGISDTHLTEKPVCPGSQNSPNHIAEAVGDMGCYPCEVLQGLEELLGLDILQVAPNRSGEDVNELTPLNARGPPGVQVYLTQQQPPCSSPTHMHV